MGVLQFVTVRAVDDVGNGFRLYQVHATVQKSATRVFAGFRQTNAFNTLDDLNQLADDNRVPVGVKFQNVFAGVRIRAFKKDVEKAIDDLGRFAVIADHCTIIPSGRKLCFARLQILDSRFTEQKAHHFAHLRAAHADSGNGTHTRRRHRSNNRLRIHEEKDSKLQLLVNSY